MYKVFHLYDRRRSDFKDKTKTAQSWLQISRMLSYPSEDCITRWKYVREKYSRSKKVRQVGSGASTEWEYSHLIYGLNHIYKNEKKSSLTYCKDLDMEKEQLHNTQSEIEDLTLIEHLAEGFETGELEIVQDTQLTIPIATGSNSCSTTSDPSPIEFMSHKRRRVENNC
ncbi:hypothetical protein FQA39_LY09847 [Lamprigera yunnana]|nr:hypothetical protein FQA39_LY09847 [Lamprigera yunnana]